MPEAEQERHQLAEAIDHMRREIATIRAKRTQARLDRVKQKVAQARGAGESRSQAQTTRMMINLENT